MSKKSIYVIMASVALMLFGFFYNIFLCGEFSMENASNHLLILVGLLFGGAAASIILKECNIKFSAIKITMPVYITILIICGVAMCMLKAHDVNQTIINSIMIAIPALAGGLCIRESVDKRYSFIRATFVVGSVVGVSYVLCTISTTVVIAAMLVAAECFVISAIEKRQKTWWKAHAALLMIGLTLCLGVTLNSDNIVSQRLLWYFQPESTVQFEIIKNLKWFNCTLHNNIIEFLNSEAGATHLHIANSLGIFASVIIILVQAIIVICMILQMKKFSDNKKLLAICAAVPVMIQSVVGVLSSFGLMPLSEVGAPFITTVGLEFCVLPVCVFVLLDFEGKGEELQAMLKEFIFPTIDDFDDEEFDKMLISGGSIEGVIDYYKCSEEDIEAIRTLKDEAIGYAIEYVKAFYENREFDESDYMDILQQLDLLLKKYDEKYLLFDCNGLLNTSLFLLSRNLCENTGGR